MQDFLRNVEVLDNKREKGRKVRDGEGVITVFPLLAVLCGNISLDSIWCCALMDKEPFL